MQILPKHLYIRPDLHDPRWGIPKTPKERRVAREVLESEYNLLIASLRRAAKAPSWIDAINSYRQSIGLKPLLGF